LTDDGERVKGKRLNQRPAHRGIAILDFISKLKTLPKAAFDDVPRLLTMLRSRTLRPETLTPYLTWNEQRYTRNLIAKTNLFEVMAICWGVGHTSSIHNHHDQNCWMAVPIGKLRVANFRILLGKSAEGACQLEKAETIEMDPRHPCAVDPGHPIHSVYNPQEFRQRAVSVHVYSRPFHNCIVYSRETGTGEEIDLRYDTDHTQLTG
jgi:cysteine dioxygenase